MTDMMLIRRVFLIKGKLGYLVKWKGYGDEHNSWVSQDDAACVLHTR